MEFTQYKMDPGAIADRVTEIRGNLLRNKGRRDLAGFGADVLGRRLRNDPADYLSFGPYWFALKAMLKAHGQDFGDFTDDATAQAYRMDSDEATMVAAEEFREMYDALFVQGTRTFTLDGESGEAWTLTDPDMEKLVRGE